MNTYDLDEEETAPADHKIADDLLPAPFEKPQVKKQDLPTPAWQVPIEPTPLPAPISEGSSLKDHIEDDLGFYNVMLGNCRQQWRGPTITSVDEFCKLSLTTMKLLEGRRRAANKPLGAETKGNPKEGAIFDVD